MEIISIFAVHFFRTDMKRIIVLSLTALLCCGASSICTATESSPATEQKDSKVKVVTYKVGMHCEKCVKKIESNIPYMKGVKGCDVSLDKKTVKITYDSSKTTEEEFVKVFKKFGYSVEKL